MSNFFYYYYNYYCFNQHIQVFTKICPREIFECLLFVKICPREIQKMHPRKIIPATIYLKVELYHARIISFGRTGRCAHPHLTAVLRARGGVSMLLARHSWQMLVRVLLFCALFFCSRSYHSDPVGAELDQHIVRLSLSLIHI